MGFGAFPKIVLFIHLITNTPPAADATRGKHGMIPISSKKAEIAISQNNISSKSKFKYVFLTFFLLSPEPVYLITPEFGGDGTVYDPFLSFLSWLLFIYISYLGIKKCYLKNKQIDDSNFIERLIILNVPVLIKFILIILPLTFIMTWGAKTSGFEYNYQTVGYQAFFAILVPLVTYIYYYILNESFERLSKLIKL